MEVTELTKIVNKCSYSSITIHFSQIFVLIKKDMILLSFGLHQVMYYALNSNNSGSEFQLGSDLGFHTRPRPGSKRCEKYRVAKGPIIGRERTTCEKSIL